MAKIGFIGAGKMGLGIALNLLKSGHALTAFVHRSRDHVKPLSTAGGRLSEQLESCVGDQDLIFLCLPSMHAWTHVVDRIAQSAPQGSLVIDLTSARPDSTRTAHRRLEAISVGLVDAPMLKGPPAARNATIQLLVGGSHTDVERAMPVLRQISEAQYRTGGPGTGHALKLLNNAVTLTNSAIVYETFALAAKLGIDLSLAHTVMNESAASSKRLNAIAPVLISGDHPPSFDVSTALKDIDLYCDMARDAGAPAWSGSGAQSIYRLGEVLGLGDRPVTQLGEMVFDLVSGHVENAGNAGSIRQSLEERLRTDA